MLQPTLTAIQFPDRVTVDWRRLSCGLWREKEGDIAAAYSADTFPKIKTFPFGNRLFTNCGCAYSGAIRAVVNAYPLLSKMSAPPSQVVPYSYEGRDCTFRGETFQLGPKVLFESSEPTTQEWRTILRTLYADGGYFARNATYGEFLSDYSRSSANLEMAVQLEVEHSLSKLSKSDLLNYLDHHGAAPNDSPQMDLKF